MLHILNQIYGIVKVDRV